MKSFLRVLASWRGGMIFWVRWSLAIGAVIAQRRVLQFLEVSGIGIGGQFWGSTVAVSLLVLAAVLVTPEVLWAILSVFDWAISAVFLPSEEMCPPLDYRVARMYLKQLRFEEAVERYELLSHYHPQALEAYLEGMEAAFRGGLADAARAFLQRGLSGLRVQKERVKLQECYDFWASKTQG